MRFVKRKDAERAKTEMTRRVVGSRPIRIGWGDNTLQKHCVHVMFNPAQYCPLPPVSPGAPPLTPSQVLTDQSLRAVFEHFGPVTSISLPRFVNHRLKGYGFVHFPETDDG